MCDRSLHGPTLCYPVPACTDEGAHTFLLHERRGVWRLRPSLAENVVGAARQGAWPVSLQRISCKSVLQPDHGFSMQRAKPDLNAAR